MKTERRHELQTNQLADSLAHWIERARPYSRAGLALVVAVAVAIFAWGYLSVSNNRQAGEAWNEYFDAMTPGNDPRSALSDITERYAGTLPAQWARLTLADIQLSNGTQRLFMDKKDGRDELRQAADKYLSITHESDEPMIVQQATFGLARAHEALGELEKAREEYRSITDQWPDCAYAGDAKTRADDLDRQSTKSFYDWFVRYEPPRAMANEPGRPGVKPNFEKDNLDDAGLVLPTLNKGAAGDSNDATPIEDVVSPESAEPATEKAADTTAPSGDAPAQPAGDAASQDTPPAK